MRTITLGSTGIVTPQNAFGALPIQRISEQDAVALLRRAFEGGMTFFDTARAYSNSEERVGLAFEGMRGKVAIATKTQARTPEAFWEDLETSLRLLRTDHVDLYQFHCVDQCYKPGDGTGMYECMLMAKEQGKIAHIGVTAHKLEVAFECVESGLYETLQYPLSYLASDRELELVALCEQRNVGFIAMKGLAGGLLTNARACMAFMTQFPGVLPIWGVQCEEELDEWLAFMAETPQLDEGMRAFIASERCRACRRFLPRLRLLHAVPAGYRHQPVRPHVSHDPPRAVEGVAWRRVAAAYERHRGLHRVLRLHRPLPLRAGYSPASEEEPG